MTVDSISLFGGNRTMKTLQQSIRIRPLFNEDSLQDLTTMLHRAFSPMGRLGIECSSFYQSVETTKRRAALGHCFVAVIDQHIVGTLTLQTSDRRSDCRLYRQREVISLHQFAVDPAHQGAGIGKMLLDHAKEWSIRRNFQEIALDTPLQAEDLISYYETLGFHKVEHIAFAGRPYVSCILSQSLQQASFNAQMQPTSSHSPYFGLMV